VTSGANPGNGVTITGTATCPAGKVLLGGGAQVTTTSGNPANVNLVTSYPSSTTVWSATVVSDGGLGGGATMSITAYAICTP
jgi:hypothetical protein